MLPPYIQTVSPYLKDKTRLFVLHTNTTLDDDYLTRLNNIVESINSPESYEIKDHLLARSNNSASRRLLEHHNIPSDAILPDIHRQNRAMEEKFRRDQMNYFDIKRIYDGETKYHLAMSRGYEHYLVRFFGHTDSEFLNRKYITPLIL